MAALEANNPPDVAFGNVFDFQATGKWAFEGKLVDQDPTDEPVERLLARIRAERATVTPVRKSRGRRAKAVA